MIPASPDSPGHILVVDDLPANTKLLAMILKLEGFEVSTAASGSEALHVIETNAPDVVLLDVMMPEMDGFETCRRIRQSNKTRHLPVVMVTALQEVADRVRALEAGADDFLSKPVEEVEVVARVKSLVRAKQGRDELERAYADLRRSEELRDSLTQMLVHDLRTPLTAVLVSLDLLGNEHAGALNPNQKELVSISARSGGRLLRLVNELLDVAKLESGQMDLNWSCVSVDALVEDALSEVAPLIEERETRIERELGAESLTVWCDADLIRRVLVNLLSNALKFSPRRSPIAIGVEKGTETLQIWVRDNGVGIALEHQTRIWDKFGQAENRSFGNRVSTGLGLTFCKLAIEAHNGLIGLKSTIGQGSTFHFSLQMGDRVEDTSGYSLNV